MGKGRESLIGVTAFPKDVLVVDDEPVVLRLLEAVLPERGLPVVTAASGEEALTHLDNHGFGCVLTDKNLPGIDGIAVMRAARAKQPYCACIIITGFASTSSAIEALRLGANDYIEKPFPDAGLVAAKVEHAMDIRRIEFERDVLLEKLRTFQAELEASGGALSKAENEIEMFNQVFEFRLQQATDDLEQRCRKLEAGLRSGEDLTTIVVAQLEELLISVRKLSSSDLVHPSSRGVMATIGRRLEAPLMAIRRSREAVKRGPGAS